MFGIGMPEFLLILVVALVVLGPKRLPELARSLGRGLAELKKTTGDLKQNIDLGDDLNRVQQDLQEVKSDLAGIVDKTLLEDNLTDYFKAAEHQTEAFPEPVVAADPVSTAAAAPRGNGKVPGDHRRGRGYSSGIGRNGRSDLSGTPSLFRGIPLLNG